MNRKIIRGGQVVSPTATILADVLIEGETIIGITTPNTLQWEDAEELDAEGCYVFPGVVDAHTHIQLDTGVFQTDDNWEIGTKVAAYGGVTTVVDFATQFEGQTFRQALENRLAECQPAYIDYALHMMVTDLARDPVQAAQDLAELRDMGVPSIKLYTTYKPNYYANDATILHTLRAMPADMIALFHCENNDMVEDAIARLAEQDKTGWRYHGQSRPAEAETEAALRVAHLAMTARKAIYIVHCSDFQTAFALDVLRRTEYDRLYFETCIQYLVLDESYYAGNHPEHYILQPPLREWSYPLDEDKPRFHEDLLSFYLGEGSMSVLSTDHCDYNLAKKTAQNDFRVTAGGLPGLETLLQWSYTVFHEQPAAYRPLNTMVNVLSTNPAKIFGLYPRKGALLPGSDADLVIYDPRPDVVIRQADLHTIGGYSPYEGMTVQGRVKTTLARGEILVHEGEFWGQSGRGQFLEGAPFRPLEVW